MKVGQYLIIKLIICWCNQKCLVTYQKSPEIFQGSFVYGGSID
jgi:DNA-binding transcriptional regulator of glucitol operon